MVSKPRASALVKEHREETQRNAGPNTLPPHDEIVLLAYQFWLNPTVSNNM
jgi:hypothetical protein